MARAEGPLALVMAMQKDKDVGAVLGALAPLRPFLIGVPQHNSAVGMAPEVLCAKGRALGLHATHAGSIEDGLRLAAASGARRIVIAGSLYLAGAVLEKNDERPD